MEKCREYSVFGEYDTAGSPIKHWKCYCGTTACPNGQILLKRDDTKISEHANFPYDTELTPAEEKAFYKKVFEKPSNLT